MVKEKSGGVNKKVTDRDQWYLWQLSDSIAPICATEVTNQTICLLWLKETRKPVSYLDSGAASGNYPETPREKEWFFEDFFSKLICQSFPSHQKDDSVILVLIFLITLVKWELLASKRKRSEGLESQWHYKLELADLKSELIRKQECIPVGCVPTTALAATRCQYWRSGQTPRGRHPRSRHPRRQSPCEQTDFWKHYLS